MKVYKQNSNIKIFLLQSNKPYFNNMKNSFKFLSPLYLGIKHLRIFDLFGFPIALNLKTEEEYRTKVGGLFSLVMISVLTAFFWNSTISYISKNSSSVTNSDTFNDNPGGMELNLQNFMFAISLDQLDIYNFAERPYFNITVELRDYKRQENGNVNKTNQFLQMEPCKLEKFQPIFNKYGVDFTEQFERMKLNHFICPLDDYQINLEGVFNSQIFDFVKISISQCRNKTYHNETWQPVCAPNTTVNYTGKNGISIYTTSYIINPDNYEQPITPFMSDELYFLFVPSVLFKTVNVYFRDHSLLTDDSIFIGNSISVQTVDYRAPKDYVESVDVTHGDGIFATFYLRRSQFSVQTTRQYQKFVDFLSYLGGFIEIIRTFLSMFLSPYNKLMFYLALANKVYYLGHQHHRKKTQECSVKRGYSKVDKLSESVEESQTPDKKDQKPPQMEQLIINQSKEHSLNINSSTDKFIKPFETSKSPQELSINEYRNNLFMPKKKKKLQIADLKSNLHNKLPPLDENLKQV